MPISRLPSLYVVTDRHQVEEQKFLDIIESIVREQGFMLQLREKDLGTRSLLKLGYSIQALTRHYDVPLLINDRVDVAMALGADGVHLPSESLPVEKVRQCLGQNRLIGKSVHSVEEAIRAEHEGANFIVLGPIYDTPSKRSYGLPLGLPRLEEASRCCQVPMYAIGGVTQSRVDEVRHSGAYGIAVISAIFQASSPSAAVKNFTTQLGVSC